MYCVGQCFSNHGSRPSYRVAMTPLPGRDRPGLAEEKKVKMFFGEEKSDWVADRSQFFLLGSKSLRTAVLRYSSKIIVILLVGMRYFFDPL